MLPRSVALAEMPFGMLGRRGRVGEVCAIAQEGGVATRGACRNTGGYSAAVAGRAGDLEPDRLCFYRFVVC